jgi:hypothetical protein
LRKLSLEEPRSDAYLKFLLAAVDNGTAAFPYATVGTCRPLTFSSLCCAGRTVP